MRNIFVFLLVLLSSFVFAQANLFVEEAQLINDTTRLGEILEIQVTVKNIGNVDAGVNHLAFYYSEDFDVTADEFATMVSIKPLAPGESQIVHYSYPTPSFLEEGDYYVALNVDPFDVVDESDESNFFCAFEGGTCSTFHVSDTPKDGHQFFFPIIFVHGWASNSKTWDPFIDGAAKKMGWTNGGRLDYCLNADGNQSDSDGFIQSFVNMDSIRHGDYYTVNFDVSMNGEIYPSDDDIFFNDDYSNQSAVVKQGWAVADAVDKVLVETGAEKVILVGHSMGGLAIRQYLQNEDNWPIDGQHHVAKVLTLATPNGGSNVSTAFLSVFAGMDEASEAVRDLRYKTFVYDGLFLDGGIESSSLVFHNVDVDCNGVEGDSIIGLNQKTAPVDVDYSCVIGSIGFIGDGVVAFERADLNNYLIASPPYGNPFADKFNVSSSHTSVHTENHPTMMQGLDEPSFTTLAYPLKLNTINYGFVTKQADNLPENTIDRDRYVIDLMEDGTLHIGIGNIPVPELSIQLLTENESVLMSLSSQGESNLSFDYQALAGKYYLFVNGKPIESSWRNPYALSVKFESASGLLSEFSSDLSKGCAPFTVHFQQATTGEFDNLVWTFDGGNPSTSTALNPTVIYNTPGIYAVTLKSMNALGSNTITKASYIMVKDIAQAEFTYSLQNDTMTFINLTPNDGSALSTTWDFGDGSSSDLLSPKHVFNSAGDYSVTLSVTNGCGSSDTTMLVSFEPSKLQEVKENLTINIAPNPTDGIFTLGLDGQLFGMVHVTIYNAVGQVLRHESIQKNQVRLAQEFDVADLSPGIYFVRVNTATVNQIVRLVVENL